MEIDPEENIPPERDKKYIKKGEKKLKRIINISLVLLFVLGVVGSALAASYVGVAKCKICHPFQYNSWLQTKHVKAFDNLPAASQNDPKCLKCHTTGNAANRGVQCEACHGAGSDYMKMSTMKNRDEARKAGLNFPPSEAICRGCHNPEAGAQFKGFDFADALKKGIHQHQPKKQN